jgi:hypothetical protein
LVDVVIGYVTNDIAIRMLFHPHAAKHIMEWRARSLSHRVARRLAWHAYGMREYLYLILFGMVPYER